jgi:hypothetical protein
MTAITVRQASAHSGLPCHMIRQAIHKHGLFSVRKDGDVYISESTIPLLRQLAEERRSPYGERESIYREGKPHEEQKQG